MQTWSPIEITCNHVCFDHFNKFSLLRDFTPSTKIQKDVPILEVFQTKKKANYSWIARELTSHEGELAKVKKFFEEHLFSKDLNKMTRNFVCKLPLKKDEDGHYFEPASRANSFLMNKDERSLCEKEIQKLLDLKLIEPSTLPYSCHAMYVPKMDEEGNELTEKWLVVNYKPLNKCLESNQHPLPSKDFIWHNIQGTLFYSKFDLTKGF